MKGKKSRFLMICLLCALLALGAGVREAVQAEPVAVAELVRVCNPDNNESCLAAGADGTRFLICQNQYPEFNLWLQNADGSEKKDLYLAALPEEDAEALLGLAGVPDDIRLKGGEEGIRKWLDNRKKQYGSYADALIHLCWKMPRPDNVAAAGNYLLLTDFGAGLSARIDVRTGETVLLYRMTALMLRDGTVLCLSQDTYYKETGEDAVTAAWLRPEQTGLEKTDYFLAQSMFSYPQGCALQEDGTIWMLLPGDMETVEADGRKTVFRELSVVHCDSSGNVLRRISGGMFNMSFFPVALRYSEEAGVGVVYSNAAYNGILWAFGPEDDTLKPLMVENLLPPALRYAEKEEAVDDFGFAKEGARSFLVFGLSGGGTKLLVQELESGYLLSLDLRTLKGDVMMADFQIVFLLSSHPEFRGNLLFNMGWNGGEILSCGPSVKGYMFRLPFREGE